MASHLVSPGVEAGQYIFVAGRTGAVDDKGEPIKGAEAQTRQALEKVKRVLEVASASLDDVVKVTVFLTRAEDVAAMNKAYLDYFNKEDKPARSTVIVAALVKPEYLVEIECVAISHSVS